jgi:caspase domain-containing protein
MPDASLIFDRRGEIAEPGLHAVLIGVSDYEHLSGPDEPAGDGLQMLQKLQSAALCAFELAQKLIEIDKAGRLYRPLKTLRLLVAPSQLELQNRPEIAQHPACPPNRANIQTAMEAWRADVAEDNKALAFFYYGGHGLREMEDSLLLASDFLAPGSPELDKAFKLSSIRNGMTVSEDLPAMGLDQFYFIDACREQSDILQTLPIREPPKIFEPSLNNETDDRRAPLYFASLNGGIALSDAGKLSGFTKALVISLDHASGAKRWIEEKEIEAWPINASSLKNGIQYLDADYKGEGKVELTGFISNPILCFSVDPPKLTWQVSFAPVRIRGRVASVMLENKQNQSIVLPGKREEDPRSVTLEAGKYTFKLVPEDAAFRNPYLIEDVFVSVDAPRPLVLVVS